MKVAFAIVEEISFPMATIILYGNLECNSEAFHLPFLAKREYTGFNQTGEGNQQLYLFGTGSG